MNRTEVANLLAICAAAYPHVTVTKQTAVVYAEMLADIDLGVAQKALKRLIATSQYFPTVAAIREQCAALTNPFAPSLASAWGEVISQIRNVGHGKQPDWSHPSIAVAVSTIGWREICLSENQAVLRAHFWKVYEVIAREHRQESIMKPSRTQIESQNRRRSDHDET